MKNDLSLKIVEYAQIMKQGGKKTLFQYLFQNTKYTNPKLQIIYNKLLTYVKDYYVLLDEIYEKEMFLKQYKYLYNDFKKDTKLIISRRNIYKIFQRRNYKRIPKPYHYKKLLLYKKYLDFYIDKIDDNTPRHYNSYIKEEWICEKCGYNGGFLKVLRHRKPEVFFKYFNSCKTVENYKQAFELYEKEKK